MMRKIFGGAMAFSMVGAVVLGGVLAWSNSQNYTATSIVGRISFTVDAAHLDDRIGPNDGVYRAVDNITITNTGGNTGFDLKILDGHIDFLDVQNFAGSGGDQANCPISSFAGKISDQTNGQVLVASTGAGSQSNQSPVQAQIAVVPTAPDACQSDRVSYRGVITMQTIGH